MSAATTKTPDARIERLDELRNEFTLTAYKIVNEHSPIMTYTHNMMAADSSMRAVTELCDRLLEQPAPPPKPEKKPARRGSPLKAAKNLAWAEAVEGVVQ